MMFRVLMFKFLLFLLLFQCNLTHLIFNNQRLPYLVYGRLLFRHIAQAEVSHQDIFVLFCFSTWGWVSVIHTHFLLLPQCILLLHTIRRYTSIVCSKIK